jgi:predicted Zn-dependent protease
MRKSGRFRWWGRAGMLTAIPAALLLAGCGGDPGPALSEQDRQLGAEQHPRLLAELGGTVSGDAASYVEGVGQRVAVAAGLEDNCTFTLVNSDVVNAFAVPGCYIYVTRGLLGIVNSEAELASIIAHELGHIARNHSNQQQRRSVLRSLGVVAIALISGSERLTQIAGAAAGLFDLRYSRTHEYEADDLALKYLQATGYDPFASADMLAQLGRHSAFQAGARGEEDVRRIPEWSLTHPLTENRIARATEGARRSGLARGALPEKEAEFLRAVDGLLYGDDPVQGFIIGRRFAHPVMRIDFEAPAGVSLTNSPRAVLLDGPDGLRGEFAGGSLGPGTLEAYGQRVLAEAVGNAPANVVSARSTQANGVPAYLMQASVSAQGGAVPVSVLALGAPDRRAYHFLLLSAPGSSHDRVVQSLAASFRLLSAGEAAGLRPRYIRVRPIQPGETAQVLAAQMAADRPREHFLMLNGLPASTEALPARAVKIVRYARD